jgi:hypothetical protein
MDTDVEMEYGYEWNVMGQKIVWDMRAALMVYVWITNTNAKILMIVLPAISVMSMALIAANRRYA